MPDCCCKFKSLKSAVVGTTLAAAAMIMGFAWIGTLQGREDPPVTARQYRIDAGPDAQFRIQERLIDAVPGDVIELAAGRFQLKRQLNVVADGITIRGQGSDKTILAFGDQISGAAGLEATGNSLTLEGFAVEDTAGNAIKVLGARGVTFRDVRTEWTGAADMSNGAYGLYPVQCEDVLIEKCTAIGASDAGIYVGQCRRVVVRDSRAERNVAGIEIENTIGADVYGNVATNNAGGILVFDLPGLQIKAGRNVRIFRNRSFANNHRNFAAPGNAVASVPPGTGIMIMATDEVEVFENEIENNQTTNLTIVDYQVTQKKMRDQTFDPTPASINVHDNRFGGGGEQPGGEIGLMLRPVLGNQFPDILVLGDGPAVAPEEPQRGLTARTLRVVDNGQIDFAYIDIATLSPGNILLGKVALNRDVERFTAQLEPLAATTTAPHPTPSRDGNPAVEIYRSVPKKLSEYGLFVGNGATQEPTPGVVRYELNTPLFSDYAVKDRFIKIPEGTQIDYRETDVFEFPVGTVIAKTFAYANDLRDLDAGRRLIETRIEVREESGWYGFSYLWNDEQTEATLALGGSEVDVSWIHTDGEERSLTYEVPNANQCLSCHSNQKDYVPIGPTAVNLNRDQVYGDGRENQLAHLVRLGWLADHPPVENGRLASVGKLPEFDDASSGTIEERARAWLAVNCAHCHNPAGTARTTGLDLRLAQNDPGKLGVWKVPVAAGHGSGGREYDIVPGKPHESILTYRLESNDPSIAMPNVARQLVPEDAVSLIHEWIAKMEP